MELAAEKRALRSRLAAQPAVSRESAHAAGLALVRVLRDHPRLERAERIALYAALPSELPTRPLFDEIAQAGRVCLLPRRRPEGGLEFAEVEPDGWDDLVRGASGAHEPGPQSPAVALGARDLVLVPGVAFDRAGGRLGRGAGDYDRALASLADDMPFACGLAYASRLVERVPMGPLDVRVDAFVSEAGWIDVRSEAQA